MEIKRFSSQRGRISVEGLLVRIREDGCTILTGGDKPHIGAVSIGKTDAFEQTISFIHH